MRIAAYFITVSGRWRWLALALPLLFWGLPARADLWGYSDEFGITHVSSSQKDARYQVIFLGSDAMRPSRWRDAPRVAAAPDFDSLPEPPAAALPRRFTGLYTLAGYQAAQAHLREAARAHRIDYALLKAVVAVESSFHADAVSPSGAVGLMQLLPGTAKLYGLADDRGARTDEAGRPLPAQSVRDKLADPRTNLDVGARHLARLMRQFNGKLPLALAAYNAGEHAVALAGNQVPDYPQTQGYVKNVLALYDLFRSPAAASGAAMPPVALAGQPSGGP